MQRNSLVSGSMFLARGLMPLLRLLPLGAACSISTAIAGALSGFFKREAQVAKAQLAFAFGGEPSEHASTYRKVFRHLGTTVAELIVSSRLLPQPPLPGEPVTYRPTEYIHCDRGEQDLMLRYSASKTSILALGSHFGNFELQAAFYAHCGVPLYVIGRKPNYAAVADFAQQLRSRHLLTTIWREDPSSPRKLVKALKSGAVIGALIDQDIDLENGFAPFFGLEAASPIAPIRLAVKYQTPIIYCFSMRGNDGKHTIFTGEIEYNCDDGLDSAVRHVLGQYNLHLEEFVRRCPEQWVWWHRRWRRRPEIDYKDTPEQLRSTKAYVSWISHQTNRRAQSA